MNPEIQQVLDGASDGCIVCGDCLEVMAEMPDGCVDIAVSSPPYNMIPTSKPSGLMRESHHKKNVGYDKYADNLSQTAYEKWVVSVFGECLRACKGLVWINHKTKYIDREGRHPARIYPWPIFAEVIWDCCGSLTLNAKRYAPSHEHIIGFGTPAMWNRQNDTKLTVWRIPTERGVEGHPCPFPLEIPMTLIESSTIGGNIILDPFCGSGTTCVAAKMLGRRYIGIDISSDYVAIARKRLEAVDTGVPVKERDAGQLPLFTGHDGESDGS